MMDNKLKKLSQSIVEELVDCGGVEPEYVQQYVAWTEKKLRPLFAELEEAELRANLSDAERGAYVMTIRERDKRIADLTAH